MTEHEFNVLAALLEHWERSESFRVAASLELRRAIARWKAANK
jgi:hypothetical protein